MTSEDLIRFIILFPFGLLVFFGFIKFFDYISDSDIWIRKEDRDQ